MFLSPLGERLGEGVNPKTIPCIIPSPSLSPKGERSMSEMGAKGDVLFARLLRRDGARQGVDDGGLAGGHLVVDPLVGLLHAILETDGRRPVHQLLDQGVVAVAAAHA